MGPSFVAPLERAWSRVRGMLFGPVEPERWLILGFAAFLAWLPARVDHLDPRHGFRLRPFWTEDALWRLDNANDLVRSYVRLQFETGLLVLGLVIGLLLLWIGSRGKFIFLDDLVRDRTEIVEPWRRFRKLADSLFLWKALFLFGVLAVVSLIFAPLWFLERIGPHDTLEAVYALTTFVPLLLIAFGTAATLLLMENFIVPIMYRHELSASDAWRRFLPLLRSHWSDFAIYAVLVLFGAILLGVSIVLLALVTCCIGPFLVWLPYVGSVLLLPVTATYRLYSLEFLAQFGPELAVLPTPEEPPES